MDTELIGYILRATNSSAVSGSRITGQQLPALGSLVNIPQEDGTHIYGMVFDQRIEDDGLVRQLVTAANIREDVIADNRINRTVPVEISILFCGFTRAGEVFHLLPPRPPLTLDQVLPCSEKEICDFTSSGKFGYFRHILRGTDFAIGEVFALHLSQVCDIQIHHGNPDWVNLATQEIITLLRDDYPTLMTVLGALSDAKLTQVEA